MYQKAIDYLKENAFDITAECGYQEWDEATTTRVTRWINNVLEMRDPKVTPVESANTVNQTVATTVTETVATAVTADPMMEVMANADKAPDDLPF